MNFLDGTLNIHNTIELFHKIGKEQLLSLQSLNNFDKYIIEYFYDGITLTIKPVVRKE